MVNAVQKEKRKEASADEAVLPDPNPKPLFTLSVKGAALGERERVQSGAR